MKSFVFTMGLSIMGVIALLLSATLVGAAPGSWLPQAQPEPDRFGTDPLSQAEQDLVSQITRQDATVSARLSGNERSELLLVERHRESKEAGRRSDLARRADSYLYLYNTDRLIHTVVNLDTETVDSVETYQNVQLPLTAGEISAAVRILISDEAFSQALSTEYHAITGRTLDRPAEQVKFQALIFWANSMPDKEQAAASGCGLHRCAQLLMATREDILINLLPIVNLSRRQIISTNSFLEE